MRAIIPTFLTESGRLMISQCQPGLQATEAGIILPAIRPSFLIPDATMSPNRSEHDLFSIFLINHETKRRTKADEKIQLFQSKTRKGRKNFQG